MKHHHSHIVLLSIAAAVTVFVFALYGYMRFKVESSLDRALMARNLAQAEEINQNQEKELNAIYDSTKVERAKLGTYFMSDTDTLAFIESIESLGARAGSDITLSSIEADALEAAEPGTIGKIRVRVDSAGSWSAVIRTLMLAEVLPYKASVRDVDLNMVGDIEKNGRWRATFVVEAAIIHSSK